jgi:flagellar basal-body rod modification protein FlgD
MEISSVGGNEAKPASVFASSDLADNFDNFLKLLITQLQHQDPLEPMDTNEFTSQIVQFASVEQSIATNVNLERLIGLQQANQAAAAIAYLGKRIEANGDTTALVDGTAEWNYALPEAAAQVSLLVTDEEGAAVFHTQGATDKGAHQFVWDGRDDSGNPVGEGSYTLSVTATAEDDTKIATEMTVVGIVDGVETVGDEPVLFVGKTGIPISEVIAILDARRDHDREEQV